jgi:hypothetical protein
MNSIKTSETDFLALVRLADALTKHPEDKCFEVILDWSELAKYLAEEDRTRILGAIGVSAAANFERKYNVSCTSRVAVYANRIKFVVTRKD